GGLYVLVTVISDAVGDQVVIDAGSKTLTSDSHDDGDHGMFIELPGARLRELNEEHGYVDVTALDARPAVGDRLRTIPNHACGCVYGPYTHEDPLKWWDDENAVELFESSGGTVRFDEHLTLPARPLIGCLAVAPAEGERHAMLQGRYGGNMDCKELVAGTTLV